MFCNVKHKENYTVPRHFNENKDSFNLSTSDVIFYRSTTTFFLPTTLRFQRNTVFLEKEDQSF